jgi:hypothetical protein
VRIRNCMLMMFVFTSVCSMGQGCQSGDCQPGVIAGPYTAAQTAENTAANFPQCAGSLCATGPWTGDQIEGIDAQQNIGTSYQFYDVRLNLDTNIAVGPTATGKNAQVLQWVNGQYVQAFDKVTGQPIWTIPGGTTAVPRSVALLWSSTTQPECRSATGNVQIIYDRLDNEFAISLRVAYSISGINHYAWCIAVSSGSDLSTAQTVWYAYEYKMDRALPCVLSSKNCTAGSVYYYFPDWPRIGTWSNGFYITFDLDDPTHGFTEAGFEACTLDRTDIVKGLSSNPMTCYTYMVPAADQPSLIHSVDVADIDSPTGPPSGEPEYFLAIVNPSNAQQGNNGQGVCTSPSTPCTSNQLALFTWGASGLAGPTFVTVNPYTPGCYDTAKQGSEVNTICVPVPSTNLSQLGGYGSLLCGDYGPPCLDSLGDRMANRLTYNNLTSSGSGPNGAYLTASHVVMESTSNERTGIRYYILQVSNGAATVLVNSGGSSGPPDLQDPNATLFYFMPSAALDQNGNLAMVYTTSGAYCSSCQTQYNPAINVDVLPWGASGFDPPTLIIQGTGDEENTMHWGEYAATVIDPTDNLVFYGVGEYFNTSQTGTSGCGSPSSNCYNWQTRIFRGQRSRLTALGELVDYFGEGRADFTVWRPSNGTWYSTDGSGRSLAEPWGTNGDIPVIGDYDGDGKTDTAVWRPSDSTWYVRQSSNGQEILRAWGEKGDIMVPGDYDGDGKTDFAVWRPSNGTFYIIQSSNGQEVSRAWGQEGDIPVPGDYDGDGKTDFAVWRPSNGTFYIIQSSNGQEVSQAWGQEGDVPVPGDYDGDGKTDFAIWRPSNGTWFVILSSNGQKVMRAFGIKGDVPVARDYDADGKTDFAVWRPSNGTWYAIQSSTGRSIAQAWGISTDIPMNKPVGQ